MMTYATDVKYLYNDGFNATDPDFDTKYFSNDVVCSVVTTNPQEGLGCLEVEKKQWWGSPRIFINKDNHYHLEGKKELGLLYNNFENDVFDDPHAENIMVSAIEFTINFDLLTPPYQAVQQISVYDIRTTLDNMQLKTGKRLGFKFQADPKPTD